MTTRAQRVALEQVTVDYGAGPVVSQLDLVVEPGEITALLGQSGCGKSTTLRAIAGLVTPTAGTIRFGDEDVTLMPPWRRSLGLVFQNHALFPHLTVSRNVEYGLRRDWSKQARAERVAQMLSLVGLEEHAESWPAQLSGGQSQRAALARALAPDPRILLLDEPFSALDANLRDRMRAEVESIIRQVGVTTVMVTHDQDEAMSMADRVAVMADGRIVEVGVPESVFGTPRFAYTAQFVGASNLLSGELRSTPDGPALKVRDILVRVATGAVSGPASLAVKPEEVIVVDDAEPDVVLDATLIANKYHGAVRDLVWDVPALGTQIRCRAAHDVRLPALGSPGRIGWSLASGVLVEDDRSTGPNGDEPVPTPEPALSGGSTS